jgi:hypothetical protein
LNVKRRSSVVLQRALASFCSRAVAAVVVLVAALVLLPSAPFAQSSALFWLNSGKPVFKCASQRGEPYRVVNGPGSWLDIHGVVNCTDDGTNYVYEIEYLKCQIAPEKRSEVPRQQFKFDWIGLAVYKPDGAGAIEWLYDEAKPIDGTLQKTETGAIAFGKIRFSVPKAVVERSQNFSFYVTSQGVLWQFSLL